MSTAIDLEAVLPPEVLRDHFVAVQARRKRKSSAWPTPPANLTPGAANYDDSSIVARSLLDNDASHRLRALILLRYDEAPPMPTYEALRVELGLASRQAVAHHVARLVEEGLLARHRVLSVTAHGRRAAAYARALANGENYLRRLVRQSLGSYTRRNVRVLRQCAELMDAEYRLNREGLRRGGELERKVTAAGILRECRRATTCAGAARALGIQSGALHQRLATLLQKAQEALRG